MKKIIVVLIILVIIVALVLAFGGNKKEENTSGEKVISSGEQTAVASTTVILNEDLKEEEQTEVEPTSGEETVKAEDGAPEENKEEVKEGTEMNEAPKERNTDPKRYANVTQNPLVTMEMKNGKKVLIELYPQIAPNTVENFISLINKNFYDGVIFHRVMPSFMAQGGDPQGNGLGGPGYSIMGEFSENGFTQNKLKHDIGVISMARATDPNSAGSQFFIVTGEESYTSLDGKYAAFGKVVDGMDVVYEIVKSEVNFSTEELQKVYEKIMAGEEPNNTEIALIQAYQSGQVFDRPVNPPVIKTMTVNTYGVDYQEPEKIAKQ